VSVTNSYAGARMTTAARQPSAARRDDAKGMAAARLADGRYRSAIEGNLDIDRRAPEGYRRRKGRLRAALVVFVAGLCGYGPLEMGGIFAGSEDTV